MKYEYLAATGLLFGLGDNTSFKPHINGKPIKEWQDKPLQEFLNHYGAEGWELINVFSPRAGSGFCVVFKRLVSS